MIPFFKDLFQYHFEYNSILLDELEKHKTQLPEQAYPLFCHILNAYQIWISRINREGSYSLNEVHSFHNARKIKQAVYNDIISILNSLDLNEKICYRNTSGQEFSNSIQEILFHVANHTTHHRAQVILYLRQAGIAPPATDYIFYKRR